MEYYPPWNSEFFLPEKSIGWKMSFISWLQCLKWLPSLKPRPFRQWKWMVEILSRFLLGWPLPQGGYLALLTSRQGATVPELHLGDSGKWRRWCSSTFSKGVGFSSGYVGKMTWTPIRNLTSYYIYLSIYLSIYLYIYIYTWNTFFLRKLAILAGVPTWYQLWRWAAM